MSPSAGEAAATPRPPRPFPTAPLPLDNFPRPPADNGLGVHWSTTMYGQPEEVTDYFVSELVAMNIK